MFSVAMDNAKMTIANSINVARKLSRKESDGIALYSECSAPSANITTQARKAQVMVGIPTITNKINNLPFIAKHSFPLINVLSLLIL